MVASDNRSLSGQVALVTGASQGFGAAIAKALAAQGASVAINYHSNDAMAEQVRDAILSAGGRADLFKGDVTNEVEVASLCASIVKQLGEIDILILNASGERPMKAIEDLKWQDFLNELAFFAKSPLLLAQQVLPAMKRRKAGRIVCIGSEVFELGTPCYSAYVAAKGAQLGLTRSWAKELGPYQITVNLIAPGFILTERYENLSDQQTQGYISGVPMKRMGEINDIAQTVVFLCGEGGQFITGQRIAVNGGNTLA